MSVPRNLRTLGIFLTCAVLAVAGCGGKGNSGSTGGGASGGGGGGTGGGGGNPFLMTDFAGDWNGQLTPVDQEDLPWSNGVERILSRNIFCRADTTGHFTAAMDGIGGDWNILAGNIEISTGEPSKKGQFLLRFRLLEGNRGMLILACEINEARNVISGKYELRLRTKNTVGNEVEAVDAGNFTMTLSSGPGHYTADMIEGTWEGLNYDFAPRYLNCRMVIDAQGNLTDGAMFTPTGQLIRRFDRSGVNDGAFAAMADDSVGLYGAVNLQYQGPNQLQVLYLLLSEDGLWLTGPAIDVNGDVGFLRLKRK